MREAIVEKKQDLRTTLLASILIITFETYHGNHEAALTQIRSSIQLLEDWMTPNSRPIDSSSLSPSPCTVGDELIHTFNRLEIEAMVYLDTLPIACHISRKDDRADAVENMPREFENVTEAQIFGKILMRRTIHFLCMAWTYDEQALSPPDINMYILDRIRSNPNQQALAERDRYSKELARWHSVFTPLLERSASGQDKRERDAAICLHIHYRCVFMALECMFTKNEVFFDTLMPVFAEMLSLAKVLLEEPDDDACFVFDSQVIVPLEIVAKKCRDPVIRREAIRLLFSIHRRECFLDSIVLAKICTWIVGVEEEGMLGNNIPEEARARSVRIKPGSEKGSVYVWCEIPKIGGQLGEVVVRHTIIR
jgi:hypothetical protein